MDVQTRVAAGEGAAPPAEPAWLWTAALLGVLLVALALRLHGLHDPLLDHPGWRQGDTASIARNFARLNFNFMYPQVTYNGPPPNYVELELQIVPFLAAAAYKIAGIHEVFGRLIAIAFSLGTVAVVAYFARWLFAPLASGERWLDGPSVAGIAAASFFAVFPGSVYYGRTFMPDTAMVFFLTAGLYAVARFLLEDPALGPRALARTTALLTFAYLAKPVAVIGVVPAIGLVWERLRLGLKTRPSAIAVLIVVPFVILAAYDHRIASYAEWHWASGITRLHVLPSLQQALTSPSAFAAKLTAFRMAAGMLRATMLGTVGFVLTIASFVALPWIAARSRTLLWGWLGAGIVYAFVVVTVERVDYYLLMLLPLCALAIGGAIARFVAAVRVADPPLPARYAVIAVAPLLALVVLFQGRAAVRPYYAYNHQAYRNAVYLDHTLDPKALVVIGHYGPDVQYYIDRFGWEEDPLLWTPFDEQSAIRKGARYFISIEDNRLRHNLELCAWMARFPVRNPSAQWIVYETDPAKLVPGADAFWRAFRVAEKAGRGRAFLDAHHVCVQAAAVHKPMTRNVLDSVSNASGPTVMLPRNG